MGLMMQHGWPKLALAGAAIALLAGGAALYLRWDHGQLPAAPAPPQPIPVIATTVQRRDVPIVLTGLGAVTALNTATVQSQVTEQLASVDFKGRPVRQERRPARPDRSAHLSGAAR
jgi:membrane fusion protein, multidrug efflux system